MFIRGDIVDIEFVKHINVIDGSSCDAGDSGIGKTFMFDSLNEAYENRKLTSDKNLHFFSSIRTANNLQFTENDCIILDEANYAPNERKVFGGMRIAKFNFSDAKSKRSGECHC